MGRANLERLDGALALAHGKLGRADHSKIRLRAKSEAPFAAFDTARSALPLSSTTTQPSFRATIAPMRPKPATRSPGPAVWIAPSIFSQTRSASAPTISIGRAPIAARPPEAATEPVAAMSTAVEASADGGVGPRTAPPGPRG